MAELLPFHGLLPVPERAAQVAAVPYDVVNTREAAELAKDNPYSFLHVSRPEIDLERGIDLHDERVYRQAGEAFRRLCREVPLSVDAGKHLYLYQLQMGDQIQTGVIGAASAAEYKAGIIKKHEKTRQDKEDDRTRHVMELRSHTGPAFFTYRGKADIDALIAGNLRKSRSSTSPLRTGFGTRSGASMRRPAKNSPNSSARKFRFSTLPTDTTAAPQPRAPRRSALRKTRITRGKRITTIF